MFVSVVICAYTVDRYDDLREAIESILNQTHDNLEIILVIDKDRELYNLAKNEFDIKILFNDKRIGLPASRNRGISVAEGDIVAFFDDDAVADKRWIEELVRIYEEYDAISVGGKILPLWIDKKPRYLPEEFYWLIGATYLGFPEKITEVRNTFTSNLSFKIDVLKELGGFRSELTERSGIPMQSEETEICERMRIRFGKGVIYNPDAIVYHKIYPEKLRFKYLLKRSFWQGYSKALMKRMVKKLEEEKNYLKYILFNRFKYRLKEALRGSKEDFEKFAMMWLLTLAVGVGYIYGSIASRSSNLKPYIV